MPWISKKAKAQMRERKKRVEAATKKRKLEEGEEVDPNKNWEVIQKDTVHTVTIPSTATSKEASKLRKEARRAARRDGRDETLIRFVDEKGRELESQNTEKSQEQETEEPQRKKRKKKNFPSINQMLAEAEEQKKVEIENEKKQAYENSIPDEVKKSFVALDCEMVGIGSDGKQSALARVSITDWDGNVILDTFVQVPDRVTDFRTHVSGVRAKDIKFTNQNAMELHACRKKVGEILKGKILVGHSLKNDFSALMLDHPKSQVRDTARYKPFMRASGRNGGKMRPRKLRDLVKEHCGLTIQKEGEEHTSVEDAQATMKLYKSAREKWEKEIEAEVAKRKKR